MERNIDSTGLDGDACHLRLGSFRKLQLKMPRWALDAQARHVPFFPYTKDNTTIHVEGKKRQRRPRPVSAPFARYIRRFLQVQLE
jgi:hypothetical protein